MFYKLISADNTAMNGGTFDYNPYLNKWTPPIDDVEVCTSGYHLTSNPWEWYKKGAIVYVAEGKGESDTLDDKTAFSSVRLNSISHYYTKKFRRLEDFESLIEVDPDENVQVIPVTRTENLRDVREGIREHMSGFSTMKEQVGFRMIESVACSSFYKLGRFAESSSELEVLTRFCHEYVNFGFDVRTELARFKGLLNSIEGRYIVGYTPNFDRVWVI